MVSFLNSLFFILVVSIVSVKGDKGVLMNVFTYCKPSVIHAETDPGSAIKMNRVMAYKKGTYEAVFEFTLDDHKKCGSNSISKIAKTYPSPEDLIFSNSDVSNPPSSGSNPFSFSRTYMYEHSNLHQVDGYVCLSDITIDFKFNDCYRPISITTGCVTGTNLGLLCW